MIATFPHFTDLNENLRDEFVAFTSRFEPYSDFNFTSLYCWNIDGSTKVSWLNGNLVIQLPDYLTGEPVFSILGDNLIDESLEELSINKFKLIPEVVVRSIKNKEGLVIIEDPDNFDYIYELASISNLSGRKFKKKRNKANEFEKSLSGRLEVKKITSIDNYARSQLQEIILGWGTNSEQSTQEQRLEHKALSILLDNASELNLLLTMIEVDGKSVAFSINETLANGFAICHFEKAIPVHDQIFTFVAKKAAQHLLESGCDYVNWEQDLGLEGLRRSKMAFNPDRFLKKYKISLKD